MNTIFEALRGEHDKHRQLLAALSETEGDSKERQDLFGQLKLELQSHANAEERAFYAILLEDEMTQPKASHSIKEHQDIDESLQELAEIDFSNPHWLRKFKQLKELVEHHMKEEEHEVFQLAGKYLLERQKKELTSIFQKEKQKELEK